VTHEGVTHEGAVQPPEFGPGDHHLSYVDATALLSVVVQQLDHTISVIHVAGEVDMGTGPLLQDHLRKVLATQPVRLVIDLSQVSFMGLAGVSVLISARHAAAQQNTALQLRGTHRRAVAVPLRITGVDHLFDIVSPDSQR
jgi:anti-anti-sigma factor